MVNSAWTQAQLGYFKTPAFAPQNVFLRHPDIIEFQMHVAMWGVVLTEHLHSTEYR